MGFVLMVHSLVRWGIVLIGLLAIAKFAIGWRRGIADKMDRGLMSGFTGLMDLQALLGFIFLLFSEGGFPRYRIEHAITMIVAVAVAHLPMRWRGAPDAIRLRNNLIVIVVSLLLIVVGVASLPGGWTR